MLEQIMYWITGLCILATIYIVFFKQEFAEIGFSSLSILLSITIFFYTLFGKFALSYGEVAYAVSCILTFFSIENSIWILINIIKRNRLEKEYEELKRLKLKIEAN